MSGASPLPGAPPRAALVWDPTLATYRFRPGHPLNPRRLELATSLIDRLGLAGGADFPIVAPRAATEDDLRTVHDPSYVDAVRRLSSPGAHPLEGMRWGLGTEDTPLVPGMHAMGLAVVGATLTAAELVMGGRARRAFTPAGGLHHAMRDRASGFCVYNDLAVAAEWMKRAHGARVMVVDFDAHHGDGTQALFYDDPEVLTVSYHESGVYLFPSTGFTEEIGSGDGTGYSVNVPLEAHTGDDSWITVFRDLVPELAAAFRPDVLLVQCGCDGHAWDPLAHLRATTNLYPALLGTLSEVADAHCDGRIVATGGGGYAVQTVVPRAWTLAWATLSGQDAPDAIPEDWRAMVRAEDGFEVPATLRDPPGTVPLFERAAEIARTNDHTMRSVRRRVLPLLTGWGLGF